LPSGPSLLATSALLVLGLAPDGTSPCMARALRIFRNDLPSRADYERMERGYYEQILDAGRRLDTPTVAGALSGHSEPIEVEQGRMTDRVGDVREYVLKPNMTADPGRRIPWTTNSRGMRDRDYPVAKSSDTYRIGLTGDSIAAGWAVEDGQGFEALLEKSLEERAHTAGGPVIEVLNFAVPGHSPGQRWTHFSMTGWAFTPDLVVFQATLADLGWDERRLRVLLERGIGFDAPVYRATLSKAGVAPGLDASAYKRVLKPLRWEILAGVYRAAAADCRARGVPSVWVLIPRVGKLADPVERQGLVALARSAGFDAVVDACDAYAGADATELAIAPNDFHPNAEGHARIARALLPALATWTEQENEREPGRGGPR
jgi:hypothetical protein